MGDEGRRRGEGRKGREGGGDVLEANDVQVWSSVCLVGNWELRIGLFFFFFCGFWVGREQIQISLREPR